MSPRWWICCCEVDVAERPDEELDYDRYAAAEAELAWLNHEVTVRGTFAPGRWAMAALSVECADVLIGHAKVTVSSGSGGLRPPESSVPGTTDNFGPGRAGGIGLAKASLTGAGEVPSLDLPGPATATTARAVFNLRVAWSPAELDRACTAAIAVADRDGGTTSTAAAPAAFQPAYPRPTHRVSFPD